MPLVPGLQLPFGVQPVNPVAVDSWSGPYTGSPDTLQAAIDAANAAIPSAVRFKSMEVRLVVEGVSRKFWYRDGILDTDLVEFVGGTGSGLAKIQQLDLLPAVGATFKLTEGVNLRLAWSQTLARPSFKEMGPVLTKDFTDDQYFLGNPNLQLSKANNYDFRAEWFPRAGEVVAASLFYKDIQAPMEQTSFETGGDVYFRYENFPTATVYGLEVEARKRLDQVASWLKRFTVSFNFSQIQSQVTMPAATVAERAAVGLTGNTRPLQGQPNYLINAGLNYDDEENKFYAGLFYNVTGPFLYAVGTKPAGTLFLLPDIYEQPAPSLDFNLTQGLTDNWKITFRGKNLLNPVFQRTQNFQGTEYTYSSYTKGWDLSLNAAYSF
ncbi:MAG: hypothetical protein EBV83_00680 [Verrucomicrobia bacterium]|nr:hypothetical protein [Verrucomicrobiota bacterium]